MTKPPSKTLLGHATTDEKGNRTWEWQSNVAIDTAIVKALGDGLSIESSSEAPQGSNPYHQNTNTPSGKGENKRRTLDDMRRLSDEIKRSKRSAPDK